MTKFIQAKTLPTFASNLVGLGTMNFVKTLLQCVLNKVLFCSQKELSRQKKKFLWQTPKLNNITTKWKRQLEWSIEKPKKRYNVDLGFGKKNIWEESTLLITHGGPTIVLGAQV